MLLALAAKPNDMEIMLITVTYGNVDVQKSAFPCQEPRCSLHLILSSCLRNVVSMFHVIEQELQWRKSCGIPEGFEQLKRSKPLVAIGAESPLGDQMRMADYFRMHVAIYQIWCRD